jgi:DNA (cytosine-5)-methyltransferase 1
VPKPIATWNAERDVWETDQGDLLSGLSDVFSETWPHSGTWVGGTAYELPPSERPMGDSGSSSLPTPRATRGGSNTDGTKGGPNQRGSSGDLMLPSAEAHGQISGQYRAQMANALTRWGDYADAIARWEHITRPAPEPTMLSRKGTPQLSPAFSEWMMGLPAGWVTDAPGITRNEALRALGNGVVPQQAAAAVAFLLDVLMRSVPIS